MNRDKGERAGLSDDQDPLARAEEAAGRVGSPSVELALLAGWRTPPELSTIFSEAGIVDYLLAVHGVLSVEPGHVQSADPGGGSMCLKIVFDPKILSFAELLEKHFFRFDPTAPGSVIFYLSADQQRIAEEMKTRVASRWKVPVVTAVIEAGAFVSELAVDDV